MISANSHAEGGWVEALIPMRFALGRATLHFALYDAWGELRAVSLQYISRGGATRTMVGKRHSVCQRRGTTGL